MDMNPDFLYKTTMDGLKLNHSIPPVCTFSFNVFPRIYHCEPGWSWAPPPLPDMDVWCVLGGTGKMVLEGNETRLTPGCCWILSAGSTPVASHTPQTPLVVCSCHLDFLDENGETVTYIPELSFNTPIQVSEVRRLQLLSRFLVGTDPKGFDAQIAFWQLLHLLQHPSSGAAAKIDERIQRVQRRIMERMSHAWDTREMASIAHLSPSRFTALFQEQVGTTPKQYLISIRMQRAANLILETDLTQAEIAENLGLQDVYFFNRQFARFHNMPPGRYRKAQISGET